MAVEKESRKLFMSLPAWNARDALRLLLEIDPDSISLDDDFDGSEHETEARSLINWLYRYGIFPRAIREPFDSAPELISEYLDAIGDVRRTPAEWIAAAVANPAAPIEWLESLQAASDMPESDLPPASKKEAMSGVTKREILSVAWPLPPKAPIIDSILDKIPKWVDPACIKVGRAGKGSHLWNPAVLALCLATTNDYKKWASTPAALTKLIQNSFDDYLTEWEGYKERL